MSECELVAFISTAACALAKCCSTEELTILSAAFVQLGDTLATILTVRELSDNNPDINANNDNIGYPKDNVVR
ncbi:LysM peptidoglycan-binding domain-containing protein [Lachnospiraceae bacterium MD1]|jgi:ABC-type transport system involved in cytochrome bd biosynthesis fused ATPase/permease subunit|uniref:LysM peptidoglycan-binding domain-containing protein n=1 Tax=Variimorphobacter saccharofermentans TaxID=2755051 RepID=A0A839K504_9FIRM|nr:DUF6774 domain-containing protein [Variimorphobacter saccharofermentans]MBB2184139.1 LysM peptidoglycan-binding domain-containing protein [Variimorphobacter saccharofermentans]